jgi:hypothetical protein
LEPSKLGSKSLSNKRRDGEKLSAAAFQTLSSGEAYLFKGTVTLSEDAGFIIETEFSDIWKR